MKTKLKYILTTVSVFAPSLAFACTTPNDIETLFTYALCILSGNIIPFLIGLGLILFLIGVVGYVAAGDNEEKRTAGRDLMWFGIIALFVMIGVWGFVKILTTSFGFEYGLPSLPPESKSVFKS